MSHTNQTMIGRQTGNAVHRHQMSQWLDRLYHIEMPDTKEIFGGAPVTNSLRAYFTLRIIP